MRIAHTVHYVLQVRWYYYYYYYYRIIISLLLSLLLFFKFIIIIVAILITTLRSPQNHPRAESAISFSLSSCTLLCLEIFYFVIDVYCSIVKVNSKGRMETMVSRWFCVLDSLCLSFSFERFRTYCPDIHQRLSFVCVERNYYPWQQK